MTIREKVADHLHEVGSITRLEALGLYGCMDITTVIRDLRSGAGNCEKINIKTNKKRDNNGKFYARYTIVKGN